MAGASPLYNARRRRNGIAMGLSFAATLFGLGWLVVVIAAVVLLIDLTDRLGEWVERRRWGRRR